MPTTTPTRSEPSTAPPPTPPRPTTGPVVLGILLIAAGTLWLLAALGVDVPVAMVTPIALVVLGLAVLAAAVRGEDHVVLGFAVAVGVLLSIGAIATTLVGVPLTGAVGDRDAAPATVEQVDATSRLFAGTQRLDLRDLVLPEGTTEIALSTVLGEVEVRVPEGMAVRVDASVAMGAMVVLGERVDGVGLDRVVTTGTWDTATQRLDLQVGVGLGEVRVISP